MMLLSRQLWRLSQSAVSMGERKWCQESFSVTTLSEPPRNHS
jgi:hypothetical protein